MAEKVDTWMPLLIDKYLGDTTHLSTEQHGAYLLLLMSMWKRGGSLPKDDKQLRSITRLDVPQWREHRSILLAFFTADGPCLRQKRLTEEMVRAEKNNQTRAENGKKGAAARWQKDGKRHGKTMAGPLAGPLANDMAESMANPWQTDAPIPTPKDLAALVLETAPPKKEFLS